MVGKRVLGGDSESVEEEISPRNSFSGNALIEISLQCVKSS
jgi:hypothetical protein